VGVAWYRPGGELVLTRVRPREIVLFQGGQKSLFANRRQAGSPGYRQTFVLGSWREVNNYPINPFYPESLSGVIKQMIWKNLEPQCKRKASIPAHRGNAATI
jgi:hypothetical protein